jgi:hypothetical protein
MTLTVEFLGLSRRLTQTKECLVDLEGQVSLRDVLRELASRFPGLLGPIIIPDTFDLSPSYLVNLDGRRAVTDPDIPLHDGQRLLFMFVEAGG